MKRSLAFCLMGAGVLALAACGYRGDLERAPPRWGEDREEYVRSQQAGSPPEQETEEDNRAPSAQQP
jgi:predicted small lipoprotein YifL